MFNQILTFMLRQALFFVLFILIYQLSLAQQRLTGDTIILPQNLSRLIPNGYTVIDTVMGNLNLDKYTDIILVLKAIGEDTAEYTWDYKRPIILVISDSNKTYSLAVRNDNVLYTYDRSNPFGDSYGGIKISDGMFKVNQNSGGSSFASEEEITFKFSAEQNTWYLYKVVEESWTRNRTRKGVERADVEKKIYTQKNFGLIPLTKYKDWR